MFVVKSLEEFERQKKFYDKLPESIKEEVYKVEMDGDYVAVVLGSLTSIGLNKIPQNIVVEPDRVKIMYSSMYISVEYDGVSNLDIYFVK